MTRTLLAQRLGALAVAGWLLFDHPLLALWPADALIGGLPLRPVALFVAWCVLIVVLAVLMESAGD